MLFLPESILETRRKTVDDIERGVISSERGYTMLLELDPNDYIALSKVATLREEAGDVRGAEDYLWRAAAANPCYWFPYMALSRLAGTAASPEDPLSAGLIELALRKILLDEAALAEVDSLPEFALFESTEEDGDLTPSEQLRGAVEAFRSRRDLEPLDVTERLRPHRLIQELLEAADLDPVQVKAMVQAGPGIVPLLIGILRAWAQSSEEEPVGVAENALALLGETGGPTEMEALIEFLTLKDPNLRGAAGWAVDRIVERHPDAAAQALLELIPGLDGKERAGLAERLILGLRVKNRPRLLARLWEDFGRFSQLERDVMAPPLLASLILVNGKEGQSAAGAVLRQHGTLLSREAYAECLDIMEGLRVIPPGGLPDPPRSEWTVYDICGGDAVWDEDEDEELDEALEPVQRPARPGRNEPCWCGSGKKYKKCHLEADGQEQHKLLTSVDEELDAAREGIGNLLHTGVPVGEKRAAEREFDKSELSGKADPVAVVDWLVHDWVVPAFGRCVVAEYLRRNRDHLGEHTRQVLDAWAKSFPALFEVQDVKVGTGVELKDFATGKVLFAHDVSLSKAVTRWDCLLTRLIPGERGTEITGVGLMIPRQQTAALWEWMEADRGRLGLSWPDYYKQNGLRIRRRAAEIGEEWIQSLRLANSDGEEILFSKAIYRMVDEEAALAALRRCVELQEDEDRFAWLDGQANEDGRTVLGSIARRGMDLVLECNSRQRLERGRELLAKTAGGALQHLRDEFTSQQEMKRMAARAPGARELHESKRRETSGEDKQLMEEFLETHYAAWPDTELPALGGVTPRTAVKTTAGKREVISLLRDFENMEERKRKSGEPCYDVSRIRAVLGLKP